MSELEPRQWSLDGGRYRIEVPAVHSNGMSDIFKGIDNELGVEVAIKRASDAMPYSNERIAHEAAVLNKIGYHDHISYIRGLVYESGRPHIIMNWLGNQTLQDELLDRSPITPDEVLPILDNVASALDHISSVDIVHRDVKPENIMLYKNNAYLIDFGVAADLSQVQESNFSGTFVYSPPEAWFGIGGGIDGRSDVYSLGVVALESLTGYLPLFESDAIVPNLNEGDLAFDLNPLYAVLPKRTADNLSTVFKKALSKNKETRHKTAEDFVKSLRKASK